MRKKVWYKHKIEHYDKKEPHCITIYIPIGNLLFCYLAIQKFKAIVVTEFKYKKNFFNILF